LWLTAEIFWEGLKAGLVTFGGAFTVIPYLHGAAVDGQHWLTDGQFVDGLAISGVLPAPLIIFPTPRRAMLLGAALSGANPKNLALTFAVAATIAEAGLDDADMVVAVVLFIALGSAAVGGPVLFYLIDADRAARPLAAIRRYMSENNAVITTVVLLLLGA